MYVKTGEVQHAQLAALSRALNDRLLAEYDENLTFSAEQAEQIQESAAAFVEVIRDLLDRS
jgi:uncharacterized protein (UPF0332 family)